MSEAANRTDDELLRRMASGCEDSFVTLYRRQSPGVYRFALRMCGAAEIGDDRPIDIVSERWSSPELQLTVISRTLDPRSGKTLFKLANLRRVEPARYLFDVPADYKINEGGKFEMKIDRKD